METQWKLEELSRSHIASCGDELGEMPNFNNICGAFFKELFENIDAETETEESPSRKLTQLSPKLS